jgi:pyruvate ferredoxin oxidoreductase alpha subunit
MGAYAMPELYTEAKYAQEMAIMNSRKVIEEVMDDFSNRFGRRYRLVETYNTDKADVIFIALGSVGENVKTAIDELKLEGVEAGLVQLRLFRPFPAEELSAALKGKKRIAVLERAMPSGARNGPLYHELSSLLCAKGMTTKLENYIVGLGGRDVLPEDLKKIITAPQLVLAKGDSLTPDKNFTVIGVRA